MRAAAFAILLVAGCSGGSPVSVADRFVGRYYVEVDHGGALALSTAGAAERVRREIDLVVEARRGGGAPGDRPRVYFERLGDPVTQGEGLRITYKLKIHLPTGVQERLVVVELAKVGGDWRVSDFTESS